ncbi:hypothetical protein [Micromonospora arborensis]|uniref:hypothetical protein n=1 Tax=Micromonospora arborensis TaxID=2116518 RepID=UPI001ABFB434|nr:hypothetical protein [Micromonospora arborensis]
MTRNISACSLVHELPLRLRNGGSFVEAATLGEGLASQVRANLSLAGQAMCG